jgi:putative sigma-54 modulation protein
MKISYTGRHEAFPQKQRSKFEVKLQKLSKTLDRRGEKEAHVIFTQERFLNKVEITLNAWDHRFVGVGSNADLNVAAHEALDRLEKQTLKLRTKRRDTKRHQDKEIGVSAAPSAQPQGRVPKRGGKSAGARASSGKTSPKKVFRVNHGDGKKPMTLEEAMLEMETSQDYMVYRDTKTDRVTVLMRRPDGHFDLIES